MQIQTVDIQNIQKGNTHASKMPPPFPPSKVDETMRWSWGGFEFKADSATHSIFQLCGGGKGVVIHAPCKAFEYLEYQRYCENVLRERKSKKE